MTGSAGRALGPCRGLLRERGFAVTVLEAEQRVGGKMSAREEQGFGLSHGPSVLTTTYREFTRLARDVGVGDSLVPLNAEVGVARDGRIHRLRSSGPGALLDALRTELLSPRSKLLARRLLLDALRAARTWRWTTPPGGPAMTPRPSASTATAD